MRRLGAAGLGTLALLTLTASPSTAATLVTPIRGDTAELRVADSRVKVRIPLELADGVCARDLRATVISVALGQRLDLGITDAFSARFTARAARGPALILSVDVNPGLEDGSYSVLVQVRETRGRERGQRMPLTVVHPPAKLRPPAVVKVERTSDFLWGVADGDTKVSPLPLRENGGKSKLSEVKIFQVERPGGEAGDGELVFTRVPVVPPSGSQRVRYELAGDFDNGATTGILEIEAPQLESPVAVAYEVKERLHLYYIPLIALGGVFVGYLLRVWLKRVTDRSRARLSGIELVELIDREIKRRKDEKFRTEARTALEELRRNLRSESDAAKLLAAVTAGREALGTALKDLDAARNAEQDAFERLQVVVETPRLAPPAIQAALDTANEDLTTVERKLTDYDPTGASAEREEIEDELRTALLPALADWRNELESPIDSLEDLALPPALAMEITASRTALAQALASSTIDAAKPDLDKALTGVHEGELIRRRLLGSILPRFSLVVQDVTHTLAEAGREPDGNLPATEQELLDALSAASKGDKKLDTVARATAKLTNALENAILAEAPETARERARQLLSSGRYDEAARVVAEAALAESADTILGPAEAQPEAQALERRETAWADLFTQSSVPPLALLTRTRVRERDPVAELRTVRLLGLIEGIQASIIRSVLIGLLLALGALVAFHSTWDGSLDEVIAVFFWGFGLDFTVESAIDIARGTKQEEQAAAKA